MLTLVRENTLRLKKQKKKNYQAMLNIKVWVGFGGLFVLFFFIFFGGGGRGVKGEWGLLVY